MGELKIEVDRSSPVPLYLQIAEAYERAIRDGALSPGTKLDNEIALADQFNISRPTIRQAMDKLVREGLVVRRRGVGTQVVGPRVRRNLKLSSLYNDLQEVGAEPKTEVLSLEVTTADDDARELLGLAEGTEVHHLRRLRSIGQRPLGLMENWIPRAVADMTVAELEHDGLYNVLRRYGAEFHMAQQTVGAAAATESQAKQLGIERGAPLVTVQRIALDSRDNPVELGRHVYRADLYSFDVTLMHD